MWQAIIGVVIFVVAYGMGSHEPNMIRLDAGIYNLFEDLSYGAGFALVGLVGYGLYIRPTKKTLLERKEAAEYEREKLVMAQKSMAKEMTEKIESMVKYHEEQVLEWKHEAREEAQVHLWRKIELQVEKKYQRELDKLNGRTPKPEYEEKIVDEKKIVTKTPEIFKASNGREYARLREGQPVGK